MVDGQVAALPSRSEQKRLVALDNEPLFPSIDNVVTLWIEDERIDPFAASFQFQMTFFQTLSTHPRS